jgi:hypothetical protein
MTEKRSMKLKAKQGSKLILKIKRALLLSLTRSLIVRLFTWSDRQRTINERPNSTYKLIYNRDMHMHAYTHTNTYIVVLATSLSFEGMI